MHPLSPVLAATVFNEIESSVRHDAVARAGEPVRPSRLRRVRNRLAARRGPASPPSYGPRPTVRAGRA
jgi:hypothetical protein